MTPKPWPETEYQLDVDDSYLVACQEMDRAEAALDRLRLAVEALDNIRQSQNEFGMAHCAEKALQAIGDLP